jgi:hypothetical protein
MKTAGVSGFRLLPLAALVLLASCGGGAKNATSPGDQQARSEQATTVAATVVAGGPTAIAAATANAAATQQAGGAPQNPATATAIAATVIAGGPTAIARATAASLTATTRPVATPGDGNGGNNTPSATSTPVPAVHLTLSGSDNVAIGSTVQLEIRLEGEVESVAAFNFDIVYDQRLVTLDAPEPAQLDTGQRQFQCNLPQASGDIDPDPNIGRARLVCFSFGGESAPAPQTPLTIAAITLRGVSAGNATLTFENVGVFSPNAKGIPVDTPSKEIVVR